ncbi:MAG: hypothetical protein K5767_01470 [Clostridia bacterium]|nr:hypothetical protein [Clostridia bacterium]
MPKKLFDSIKTTISEGVEKLDMDSIKKSAENAGTVIKDMGVDAKNAAFKLKDDINDKITELDRMLEAEITNYNNSYTLMNDKGIRLLVERRCSADAVDNVEVLINSIANTPKEFEEKISKIEMQRKEFQDACAFAERELDAVRTAASGAGAGFAAGASVAFMAPTAAMWIATTFGTASTGAAISTLSGAAAESAALAWLGGGALSAGGGGIAAGNALLALAGPVGWTIAGATLLSSILLFAKKRTKLNAEKNEEIEKIKKNTEQVRELDAEIKVLLDQTVKAKEALTQSFRECIPMFGGDYDSFDGQQKLALGALVNNTLAVTAMFEKTIEE